MIDYDNISEILKALSHPVRLKMVVGLCEDECNVSHIQEVLNIPQATVSQHLRILRMMKIVEERRDGKKKCYKVCHPLVKKIIDLLNNFE